MYHQAEHHVIDDCRNHRTGSYDPADPDRGNVRDPIASKLAVPGEKATALTSVQPQPRRQMEPVQSLSRRACAGAIYHLASLLRLRLFGRVRPQADPARIPAAGRKLRLALIHDRLDVVISDNPRPRLCFVRIEKQSWNFSHRALRLRPAVEICANGQGNTERHASKSTQRDVE